jgi:catechol 2,3-dioxygenase-like lactoylglutathione lyase family enzyme
MPQSLAHVALLVRDDDEAIAFFTAWSPCSPTGTETCGAFC